MSRVRERSPIVFLVVACVLWGGATVLSKHLLSAVPPVMLLALQLAASVFALWLIVFATHPRVFDKRVLVPQMLLGFLNPGLAYTLGLLGLLQISASVATLLWAAEPMIILALAGVVLREPVNSRLIVVMLIGAVGVLLVTGSLGERPTGVRMDGVLLMLGAVSCCAIYTVFSRKIASEIDPLLAVSIQQTAGLLWAVCLLPFEVGRTDILAAVPIGTFAAAAISGLLYYAAAYWLYLAALKSVPAAVAGSFFNLIPVVGVALAILFLGEMLTPVQIAGALAIMISVFLLVRWSDLQQVVVPRRRA